MVDPVNRAHVQAAGRLVKDQQLGPDVDFTTQHHLLLIAAGKAAGQISGAGRFDAVAGNNVLRVLFQFFLPGKAVVEPLFIKAALQQDIFSQCHVHNHAVAVTVQRDIAESRFIVLADTQVGDIFFPEKDMSRGGPP